EANFLLVDFVNAKEAFHTLQAKCVIVRPLQPYNLPNHLRLTIGTKEQNLKMLNILSDYLPS
ncbi:MAG: histidinol-phosphate transaminase, partial [Opitutales bacterium]|nr:histidinol-phosphate transaminase [Opitutales bacterium]